MSVQCDCNNPIDGDRGYCGNCGKTLPKSNPRYGEVTKERSAIGQACMVQGLLGFDASTKPEDVFSRVAELIAIESVTGRVAHAWCFSSIRGGFPTQFVEYMDAKYGATKNWPNPWTKDAITWAIEFEAVTREHRQLNELPTLWTRKDELKDGLQKALDLLREAECPSCHGSLSDNPSRGQCSDATHNINAAHIAEIKQILAAN